MMFSAEIIKMIMWIPPSYLKLCKYHIYPKYWISYLLTILVPKILASPLYYMLFKNFWTHYENTPIQIYRKVHLQKLKIFR